MSDNWTEEELRASVDAYIEMHRLESSGKPFTKKPYYESLANRFGRTVKSYEYRMQNISYVYSLQGRRWVSGLKPARNVGSNVIQKIEKLIAASEGQQFGSNAGFEAAVEKLSKNPPASPPKGNKKPSSIQSSVTQFVRDPAVVSWVLAEAAGRCECCEAPAPFVREDGSPFLEVHHLQRLADGGEDTTNNAVALCPNCHRELHYGSEKRELGEKLRAKVIRLQKESVK
ncbi:MULTISPECIES: HNH endonuclease [Gammaproteobacteria]|uniref:HNH endonuclease n=1 Tax=Alloalcanivorax xenomutans TaxID=1094342 RepID=UPI000C6AB314|nr:HNH endonuclease [Alloalcanivorax xenomutans]MAO61251.1 HNH endonuclease [Alcanivorax sp.]MAY10368.1 HNH endonuclease [Alcanivorax sp.]MBI54329.1 HNH endonuclease [Alcanivorax sp.]MCE7522093.1 HNH endonuclease [Alloalcanivorax xenomutans]